jgi:hypothetical protein
MADESTPAAAPSPAASETATAMPPSGNAEYANWRMTGKVPEAKPKSDASAASTKESSGAGDKPAESAPASEAGKATQEKKPRSTAETRLEEILSDLRTAGLTPSELKTFKREAQQNAEKPNAATEHTEKPAEPAKLEAPKKPKPDDFDSWDKYEQARDKYYEDLTRYNVEAAIAKDRQQRAAEAAARDMQAKLSDAKARYGDEAEATIRGAAKSIFNDARVPAAIKGLLNESAVLTDVLYAMGSKAEVDSFVELAKSNPGQAIRKLAVMEHLVAEELAKGGKPAATAKTGDESATAAKTGDTGAAPGRDEQGKFTPAKKTTEAPAPPREAAGRAAPPAEETFDPEKPVDVASYIRSANRKEIARRKGAN